MRRRDRPAGSHAHLRAQLVKPARVGLALEWGRDRHLRVHLQLVQRDDGMVGSQQQRRARGQHQLRDGHHLEREQGDRGHRSRDRERGAAVDDADHADDHVCVYGLHRELGQRNCTGRQPRLQPVQLRAGREPDLGHVCGLRACVLRRRLRTSHRLLRRLDCSSCADEPLRISSADAGRLQPHGERIDERARRLDRSSDRVPGRAV